MRSGGWASGRVVLLGSGEVVLMGARVSIAAPNAEGGCFVVDEVFSVCQLSHAAKGSESVPAIWTSAFEKELTRGTVIGRLVRIICTINGLLDSWDYKLFVTKETSSTSHLVVVSGENPTSIPSPFVLFP